MIADAIVPGLDKECVNFLFRKAQGRCKFGTVEKLLQIAMKMDKELDQPIDMELLKTADQFLMI